jgi:cytochrome P450
MEGEVVFNALLQRCRTIEGRFDEPDWRPTLTLRGLATLPVTVAS